MEKLVSILTPCYNGEKYLDRYASMLIAQDYHNCQLIFMDDGSTDNSKEKILQYSDVFTKNGIKLEYHRHENVGLGGTIAKGLKYIIGEYLIWIDQDDMLAPDSIKKRVAFMEQHPEYGVVRNPYRKVSDNNIHETICIGPTFLTDKIKQRESLFEDYLLGRDMWLQPGCFMIRMSAFDKANPDRYLFPSREGHDWQLLLPIFYHFKCGYIDEPLFVYITHEGSMSNAFLTESFERHINRMENYEALIAETVKHMDIKDEKKYLKLLSLHYLQVKFSSAFRYGKREVAKKYYDELCRNHKSPIKNTIKMIFLSNPILYRIIKTIRF